jgi:predicted transcriptional regulator
MSSHLTRTSEPSSAELEILQILWREQPCTVRTVHDFICKVRDIKYTTVLKQIQRMEEKGFVERTNTVGRAHMFKAVQSDHIVRKGAYKKLLNKAFGGSVSGLVTFALGEEKLAQDEIEKIKKLIDQAQKNKP